MMLWRPAHHKRLAQLADGLSTAASFVLAYFVWDWFRNRVGVSRDFPVTWYDFWKVLIFSIIWVIILTRLNAYTYQLFSSIRKELSIVLKASIIGVFVFFASYFLFRYEYVPRSYIFIFGMVNFFSLMLEKFILFSLAKVFQKRTKDRKKLLIVGTGERAKNFIDTIEKKIGWGVDIHGILSRSEEEKGQSLLEKEIVGTFAEIEKILKQQVIDEVVVCVSSEDFSQVKMVLEACEREGIPVRLVSDFFGSLVKDIAVDRVFDLPVVSLSYTQPREWTLYLKRLMDLAISGVLMVLLSPLFLAVALLIKLTSRGPVFYEWHVCGLNKKPFKSWKFRTMVPNADEMKEQLKAWNEMKGPVFKITNDPRITGVGRVLRRSSLDELPQLWSVFKGDMSLVGPRPPLQCEIQEFESWQRRKLSMKPGITCLWQVKGRNIINNFDDWARLDLEYIDNWSIWLDLKILLLTGFAVFRGSGR